MKMQTPEQQETFDAMDACLTARGYVEVEVTTDREESVTYRKPKGTVGPTVTLHRSDRPGHPIKAAVSEIYPVSPEAPDAWTVPGLDYRLTLAEGAIRQRLAPPRTFARVEIELQRHDAEDTTTIDQGEPVFRIVVTDHDGNLVSLREGFAAGGVASYIRNISEQMALRP